MNLTDLKNAPDGATIKDDVILGLEFRKRGAAGSFLLYYRTKSGQRRRPKIGDYPALTIQQAREIAREWLGEVARGKDPSSETKALKGSSTVAEIADAWLAGRTDKRAYRHDRGRVENCIKPEWGSRKAKDIAKADVLALKRKMADRPVAFNRAVAALNGIWKAADLPSPAKGVAAYPETQRRRYLSSAEIARLNAALDAVEPQYPHQVALIRLLALTGARLSEIRLARRSWYQDKVLTLDRHKTDAKIGGRTIVFSDAADAVVQSVSPRNGWLVGFASYPNAAWNEVRTKARLVDFNLHDLRHSYASDAISSGFSLDEIGEVLGHTDAATTKRYAHLNEDRQRTIAEAVAQRRK
jgi:integrase